MTLSAGLIVLQRHKVSRRCNAHYLCETLCLCVFVAEAELFLCRVQKYNFCTPPKNFITVHASHQIAISSIHCCQFFLSDKIRVIRAVRVHQRFRQQTFHTYVFNGDLVSDCGNNSLPDKPQPADYAPAPGL